MWLLHKSNYDCLTYRLICPEIGKLSHFCKWVVSVLLSMVWFEIDWILVLLMGVSWHTRWLLSELAPFLMSIGPCFHSHGWLVECSPKMTKRSKLFFIVAHQYWSYYYVYYYTIYYYIFMFPSCSLSLFIFYALCHHIISYYCLCFRHFSFVCWTYVYASTIFSLSIWTKNINKYLNP